MNVKCEALDTKTIKVIWEHIDKVKDDEWGEARTDRRTSRQTERKDARKHGRADRRFAPLIIIHSVNMAPPADKLNGELRGYSVSYRLEGTPFSHETVNRNAKQKVFTGLQAASVYTFSVKAFNDVDSGPASEEVSCTTLNGDPPAVPSLRVTGITSSSVSLNWNTLQNPASPVIQYLVQYGTDEEDKADLHIPGNKDTVTLRDLRAGTRYNFRLAAYNMYGRGDFSHNLPAVTHLSDGRSLQVTTESEVPFYYRTYFVVPVAASFTVIITAVVIAWACLKRATIIQKSKHVASSNTNNVLAVRT
ncbi:hypothetical protein HPB51_004787 [Rhipicephalus microplus]|uniref:Fibronectin type-III domain-containing protein n=1 Tax=Rhipicephalus microplus TaxID=6941 RepID=A0A9J6E653_RHIMP|nr:hypothetical protein HPB51_004787 [Rhipicephalus microplus]